MEVLLLLDKKYPNTIKYYCFNPCFNGSLTATTKIKKLLRKIIRFNPCFNGSLTATPYITDLSQGEFIEFQSLF